MKKFVGGYYDERIFRGDYFNGKTPFDKDIDTYTLEEALKLGFVENVKEIYEDDWNELTYDEKVKAIMNYVEGDELASLCYFDTEEVAEKYKQETLEEIAKTENEIKNGEVICLGQEQDDYGNYKEVYMLKHEAEED